MKDEIDPEEERIIQARNREAIDNENHGYVWFLINEHPNWSDAQVVQRLHADNRAFGLPSDFDKDLDVVAEVRQAIKEQSQ